MKTLIDGFGHSLAVRDEDVKRSLMMLKDAGKDYRIDVASSAYATDDETAGEAGGTSGKKGKR